MRILSLIALAALSCSPAARSDSGNATDSAARLPASPIAAPSGASPDTGASPEPGELKTFGDWTIGCDNARACQANALVPESGDRDDYLMMLVTRAGAPDAPPRLIVPFGTSPIAGAKLTVDGKPFAPLSPDADGEAATVTLDRTQAATLADGKTVALVAGSGKPVASASLAGLAATLLYMDAQQRRVGTRSALRKPGPGTTPAPPPLPVVTVPPRSGAKPVTLTVAAATTLIGADNAACDYAIGPVVPEAHRLDAAHSLVLVAHPCGNGAYNLFSSAFVVDNDGKPMPARFDAATGMGQDDGNQDLINADWDTAAQRLTTYAKARGIGDCGSTSAFAWDGTRFRLVSERAMGECRGSVDYIPIWRAAVRQR